MSRTLILALLVALAGCRTDPDKLDTDTIPSDTASEPQDADGDGYDASEDCDDDDAAVHPGADELCDEVDNDCDGQIDEDALDAETWYLDGDQDGFGDLDLGLSACDAPDGYVSDDTDCDDGNAEVFPGAPERCDGLDNDCDGAVDEDLNELWYADADGDGFGNADNALDSCDPGEGWVADSSDCDDANSSVHPEAEEVCNDTDDDCDGAVDEDLESSWYQDADGDGYGDPAVGIFDCEPGAGWVDNAEDCDDANSAIHPDAEETCNGYDDDCDGLVDDQDDTVTGTSTWYLDGDGDGYGDDASVAEACDTPSGYAAYGGDCDDTDAAHNPGASEDDCTDPNDYNCDGSTGYADDDGDGWAACEDCDDGDATINPDASETCNNVDDDCDGDIDEDDATDAATWYLDADGDGYGDLSTTTVACDEPSGYVSLTYATDCDDTDASISPVDPEVCDEVDNDCDGTVDEGVTDSFYVDGDGDGYGDATSTTEACDAPSGYVADDTDCDDGDATVNPGASEICDEVDNDCDGYVDDDDPDVTGTSTWYVDYDGDGYGGARLSREACEQPSTFVADSTDCDDLDATVYPGADELCDGVDNDCDGDVDEADAIDPATWYADVDGDGYGDASTTATGCDAPTGYVADDTDCDDADAGVNPGASEVCDSVDNDCDGAVDEGVTSTWYADADGDGYGDASSTTEACTQPTGYVSDDSDCDDGDSAVNPAVTETCNGQDDDCDGITDEGSSDADGDGTADCVDDCPVYADVAASTGGDGSFGSPFSTINEAIANRGTACDEIVAMAGTYDEVVDYAGEDLYLHSYSGAEVTIIEPSSGGTVVTFESYETADATLEGFTLSGGTGVVGDDVWLSSSYTHGGGVFVYNADPTILDCIIEDNTVTGYGGGMLAYEYDGLFSGNIVRDNASTDVSDGGGGGLNLRYSDAEILYNQIYGNDTYGSSGDGGGVMINRGAPAVAYNWIEDNYATSSGGGIRSAYAEPVIYNNVIVGNVPDGVTLSYDDAGLVANNTIADNSRYGIYAFTCCGYTGTTGPTTAVINNLITGSGTYGLTVSGYNSFSAWEYNDVHGSGSRNYNGYSDPTGSDGNLSVDPLYVGDPDWSLQAGSTLIDQGTDLSSYGISDDYDGTARPAGSGWDMGAYER